MSTEDTKVKVHVRIRPFNIAEISAGPEPAIECFGNEKVFSKSHGKNYKFDYVYNERSSQDEVYQHSVEHLLYDVIHGFNVTVFAYGQTGTGKTYTMGGGSMCNGRYQENDPNMGIIPRAINDLFKDLENYNHWFLRVSFLELYNEVLSDLLDENQQEIRIMEKDGNNVLFPSPEKHIKNKEELFTLLQLGTAKRATGSTNMNEESSRSHAVFTINVQVRRDNGCNEEVMTNGKINFVDLAGSENIGKSGAVKKRACEAGKINQSLLAIGRVINALVDKSSHVPYRESKLTRILQDSLGGNTKTTLIATVSPSLINIEETFKTLDYAQRAKSIKNHPEQSKMFKKQYTISSLENEIEKLKRDVEAQRTKVGIHLSSAHHKDLIGEYNITKYELAEKQRTATTLETKVSELIESKNTKEQNLEQCQTELKLIKDTIDTLKRNIEEYHNKCEDGDFILTHVNYRFNNLQEEAHSLLKVVHDSSNKENILIDKVNKLYEKSQHNSNSAANLCQFIKNSNSQSANISKNYHTQFADTLKMTNKIINSTALNYDANLDIINRIYEQKAATTKMLTDACNIESNCINQAATNIKETVTKIEKNVEKEFISRVQNTDMLLQQFEDSLSRFAECRNEEMKQLNLCLEKVQTVTNDCAFNILQNLDKNTAERIGTLQKLHRHLDEQKGICAQQDLLNKNMSDLTTNSIAAIVSQISDVKNKIDNHTEQIVTHCDVSKELNTTIAADISHLEEMSKKNMEKVKKVSDDGRINIERFTKDFIDVTEDILDRVHKEVNDLSAITTPSTSKQEDLFKGENVKLFEEISQEINLMDFNREKYRSEASFQISEFSNNTTEATDELLENWKIQNSLMDKNNKEACNELDEMKNLIETADIKIKYNMRKCKEVLDKFSANEFENIEHEGNTPKRTEHKIPKKFTKVNSDFPGVVKEFRDILKENRPQTDNLTETYLKHVEVFDKLGSPRKEN